MFPCNHLHQHTSSDIYEAKWTNRDARPLLEYVLPYLIHKRERAELALRIIETVGQRGQHITTEARLLRDSLGRRIKELNGRKAYGIT